MLQCSDVPRLTNAVVCFTECEVDDCKTCTEAAPATCTGCMDGYGPNDETPPKCKST